MRKYEQKFRRSINVFASFPGFFVPIALFAFLVQDIYIITLFVITLIILAIIQLLIKYSIPTQRPGDYQPDSIIFHPSMHGSFPSNHASGSFLLFFFAYGYLPSFAIVFLLFAIAASLARIYLGKHHPRDILWSIIISLIIYQIAISIFLYLAL